MTWSYEFKFKDPVRGNLDQIRFMIGDTDPDYAYLLDEEIEILLDVGNNDLHSTAIKALRRILAKIASQVDYKIGPETVNASDRTKHFQELLAQLEKENMLYGTDLSGVVATHTPVFDYKMNDTRGTGASNLQGRLNGWTR